MSTEGRVFKNKRELIKNTVKSEDVVLDIGFWGQGITHTDPNWPHTLLKESGASVYGIDLTVDRAFFPDTERYLEASAENFAFPDIRFDLIFAGDVIEHLTNPGLFLAACAEHLKPEGRLLLTTPNTFNLFNIAGKLANTEPAVNADHTMYFNHKTLRTLLLKCGFSVFRIQYVYALEYTHHESLRKKFLNLPYRLLSWFTPKFMETLVIIAVPVKHA